MSLWKIAWRSLQQRALSSWLTGLSMALGVALVVCVLVLYGVLMHSFTQSAQGYHLIVGAKGGKLQLVLNTVFHLSQPIEVIPYSVYKDFTEGKYANSVEVAVPYCLGDRYEEFRVVGTTPDLFDKLSYGTHANGDPIGYAFAKGKNFRRKDYFGAVMGSVAAAKTGRKVGDKFAITHGLSDTEDAHVHDNEKFHIVGILAPTGTPNDRAVFVNIEGFYLIDDHAKEEGAHDEHHDDGHDSHDHAAHDHDSHGHDAHDHSKHDHAGHAHHEPLPESQRELTAVLVKLKSENEFDSMEIHRSINKGQVAQAVFPILEVAKLFDAIVGPLRTILLVLAVLVVVVAGIGVMVSIYNSMSERDREIAIMRSLGASRGTVMTIIMFESLLLSLLGGLAGVLIGHAVIGALSPLIVVKTGIAVHAFQFDPIEWVLIPGLIVLASIVGYLPALSAYRTDVAKALSATP